MTVSVKVVLAAFNSDAGSVMDHTRGQAMADLAASKSSYGRALRDITAVALSGRWLDGDGEIMSDNAIGHAMGVAMRQPRARLTALTNSGLVFESDADIKANATVWAHVARMYNAGKAGRAVLADTAEMVAAIVSMDDKRAAWLDTPVPARDATLSREARPNDGVSATEGKSVQEEQDSAMVPTGQAEEPLRISEASTSTLLGYLSSIGGELSDRFGDMTVAERGVFMESIALLSQTANYAVKATAKK